MAEIVGLRLAVVVDLCDSRIASAGCGKCRAKSRIISAVYFVNVVCTVISSVVVIVPVIIVAACAAKNLDIAGSIGRDIADICSVGSVKIYITCNRLGLSVSVCLTGRNLYRLNKSSSGGTQA